FFFFQAEDGIRDGHVTGVQTCALPISGRAERALAPSLLQELMAADQHDATRHGRLSAPWRTDRCYGRERANSTAHKASSSRSPGARPYTPGRVPGAIPPLSEARGISTTDATAHRLDRHRLRPARHHRVWASRAPRERPRLRCGGT